MTAVEPNEVRARLNHQWVSYHFSSKSASRPRLASGEGKVQEKENVAVKIRLKKMGRTHRPFFRVCAMDIRSPRDGRVIEELGTYDPMVTDTDARAILKGERVDYWLSVGAKPTVKVATLIKKYGSNGTHLDKQQAALEKLKSHKAMLIEQTVKAQKPVKAEEPAPAEAAPAEEAPAEAEATTEESTEETTEAASEE